MDYKNTLNLPQTGFPMKADLVQREPQRLAVWQQQDLYAKIQASRKGAPRFVLHDGPPFANGDVHIGTALNKILKDIIIKYQSLRGKDAPYIPGWDCHGLPIEFKVSQEMRKAGDTSADAATIRKACDAYARKYIDLQRVQFKRLGVLGDWDNPYLTLNKEYEADELRLFADIVEKGFVYRAKKPVYWCSVCGTALAEAEVEYADHVSQSIYVKFPVVGRPNTFVLIWTTTPWTLPANLAIAYNKDFQYIQVTVGGENYILFRGLLPIVAEKCGWKDCQEQPVPIEQLAALEYQHPFIPARTGKAYPADFVTSDTGTGFVHIAPGHGMEDYGLGMSAGLPIYSPVGADGKFVHTSELPLEQQMPAEMLGKSTLDKHGKSDANEVVLHELRLRHALLHQENYHHSYPHCWRSKNSVIFRATDQWFIKIDHDQFRERALAEIDKVAWIPDWGVNRIKGAVQTRPDWCISRQRTWGVPIPAFYDAKGEAILDARIVRKTADVFEQHGSNFWFEKTVDELWSLVKPDGWSGETPVAKSNDTLDVWIDSGSSSRAVLMRRKELRHHSAVLGKLGTDIGIAFRDPQGWRADVYLEGSDQHRGWFQSSLLLSLAGNGAAPFRTVLTHGFMVDADREKISKSKQAPPEFVKAGENHDCYFDIKEESRKTFRNFLSGRGIQVILEEEHYEVSGVRYFGLYPRQKDLSEDDAKQLIEDFLQQKNSTGYEKPQTAEAYVKKYGADVVRLWVASQDYRNDIVVSEERINKVGETYRGIRNTLRYQLSNLYDFDPAKHTVPGDKLTGLDRWILGEFSRLENEVLEAYDKYEFHVVYQKISQFVAVELSAIYHDVVKDRLYTDPSNSTRRRSTQTALHRLVSGLCRMLSPIIVFTSDEAWEFVPRAGTPFVQSVHVETWDAVPFSRSSNDESIWKQLFELREQILPELERARQAKIIGKALDAKLSLSGSHAGLTGDAAQVEALRELLNVSQLHVKSGGDSALAVQVDKADGEKCERCWHWETDVGSDPGHPTICARCVTAVKENTPPAAG